MLRRLKVRTRLVAVIAVPLALLLAVAVPEVVQRRSEAADADRAAALATDAAAVAAAVDALQGERTLSAAQRAGADEAISTSLESLRTNTDGTVDRARTALARLADRAPDLAPAATAAVGALDSLEALRDETDAARSIVTWRDPFLPVIDLLLTVQEELGDVVADPGVSDQLTQVGLLARSKDAAAAQAAQMAAAATWGELRGDQAGILASLRADELAYRTAYLAASPTDERVDRRAEVQQGSATTAGRLVDQVVEADELTSTGLAGWLEVGTERQIVLRDAETVRAAEALDRAEEVGDSARQASTVYAALAGGGLLLAFGLALSAARSITRPLRRLTLAADELAEERLPRLVDALRNPGDAEEDRFLAATMSSIEVDSDDELAHLGRALNAVQAVAVDVAAEQADLLRKGISDLYVNLARRNQALIERQIQLLDQLEQGEQDPGTLEHLYLLDHLATRMRRNAESLLVLAGADTGPRRARSIDVVDVVRAALSEVEDYERIDLGTLADATLQGPAVSDVAHILAELLENATHFSPPHTTVRVDGARSGGSYQIVISDRGVGMQPDQLDALNAVLREPPVTGLALGRSLGCLVAARLAARHGITVRLRAGEHEGVSAYVILPRSLMATVASESYGSGPEAAGLEPPSRLRDALPVPGDLDASFQALLDGAAPPALVEPAVAPRAERADHAAFRPPATAPAVTERDDAPAAPAAHGWDDADNTETAPMAPSPAQAPAQPLVARRDWDHAPPLPTAGPTEAPAAPAGAPVAPFDWAGPTADEAFARVTAHAGPPPASTDRDRPAVAPASSASGGLVRRVPGAQAPQATSTPTDDGVRRSPDEVRALLSRYRSGLRAGRSGQGGREEQA